MIIIYKILQKQTDQHRQILGGLLKLFSLGDGQMVQYSFSVCFEKFCNKEKKLTLTATNSKVNCRV